MVFWGVEVKPGKPFTLPADNGRAKLHVAVATLGIGSAEQKSYLQVNVGNKIPIFLCCLSPNGPDSIPLHVDFEEDEEVVFSVLGPRSVHLCGKYLVGSGHFQQDDESESYGEDIADTETERSANGSDEYEASFIDDSDQEVIPAPPDSIDEVEMLGKRKSKGKPRRLQKKYQSSESEEDDVSLEKEIANGSTDARETDSESEDVLPISSFHKIKPSARYRMSESEDEDENGLAKARKKDNLSKEEMKDDDKHNNTFQSNIDVVVDGEPKRKPNQYNSTPPSAELLSENGVKVKEKRGEQFEVRKPLGGGGEDEDDFFFSEDVKGNKAAQSKREENKLIQDLPDVNAEDRAANNKGNNLPHLLLSSTNVTKAKKKRREQQKVGRDLEAKGLLNVNVIREDTTQDNGSMAKILGQEITAKDEESQKQAKNELAGLPCKSKLYPTKAGSENGAKQKKKRKKWVEEETPEVDCDDHSNVIKEDKTKKQELKSNGMEHDLFVGDEKNHKEANIANKPPDKLHSEKKKTKKRMKRDQGNGNDLNLEEPSISIDGETTLVSDADPKLSQLRTMSNGLVIQELKAGRPDGKIAAAGKKISVHYTGKLRESGQVFESNIDGTPLKFRLGDGEILKGWNVGLDGMRVGEKRRVIVPPSMGYDTTGDGKKVPPNSWLVYDVELLKVR